MGSVVINEAPNDIHPWSNMIDARSHHSDNNTFDTTNSYRSTPTSSTATRTRRRTSSQGASKPPIENSISSPEIKTTPNALQNASTPSQIAVSSTSPSLQDSQPPPNSPNDHIAPTDSNPLHMSDTSPQPNTGAGSAPATDSSTSSPQPRHYDSDSPNRIKVRDLQHIQSFALENANSTTSSTAESEKSYTNSPQYEISDMPIADIIEMVAGLLTKITATNDQHYEHLHRQILPPESTANISSQTSSVLAFHGKNVPSISILSYLTRIHKYCPATWEVFLSLLVYFDRMTERVNSGPIQSLREADQEYLERSGKNSQVSMKDAANEPEEPPTNQGQTSISSSEADEEDNPNLSNFFVVDSFNIHRLVIAGVTCAAKYFSDIFFTNSRYAKVGGLPLMELNHLELQFLVLNDFRLAVPVEELEAYATMLVEFYAREVTAQNQVDKFEGIEMVTR